MTQFLAVKTILLASVFMALFAAETLVPKVRRRLASKRYISNLGLWALTVPVSALIVLPLTLFASNIALWTQPVLIDPVLSLFVNLILLDLFIYWSHRAFHEIDFLWRLHKVHHLDETLDTTSAVRFHFAEVILSACLRAGFVFTLAVPFTTVVVFEILVLASALFQHSNLRLPGHFEEGLRKLVVTPSHHWVHHHPGPDLQTHYGSILTVWDRAFKTWSPTRRDEDMVIGLANRRDLSLKGLLLAPFRPADYVHPEDIEEQGFGYH